MNVLFVGDRASRLNNDPNVAFVGAACEKRLRLWIEHLGIEKYELTNSESIADKQRITNHDGPVIALGKEAQARCFQLGKRFIALPHPSGRNRQLNDVDFIIRQLNKCKIRLEEWHEKKGI